MEYGSTPCSRTNDTASLASIHKKVSLIGPGSLFRLKVEFVRRFQSRHILSGPGPGPGFVPAVPSVSSGLGLIRPGPDSQSRSRPICHVQTWSRSLPSCPSWSRSVWPVRNWSRSVLSGPGQFVPFHPSGPVRPCPVWLVPVSDIPSLPDQVPISVSILFRSRFRLHSVLSRSRPGPCPVSFSFAEVYRTVKP